MNQNINEPLGPEIEMVNLHYQTNHVDFKDMYFSAAELASNFPKKQRTSMHAFTLLASFILWTAIAVCAFGFGNFLSNTTFGIILGVSYAGYLYLVFVFSTIRKYIAHMKLFNDYQKIYKSSTQGLGYFHFYIQCYHYERVYDPDGDTQTKVVTHTASKDCYPKKCVDMSGNVAEIYEDKKYFFTHYMRKFYFPDQKSAANLQSQYAKFIKNNTRDRHQNKIRTFEIKNFQQMIAFSAKGTGSLSSIFFFACTVLGLALPYSFIMQFFIARYHIDVVKKLTY